MYTVELSGGKRFTAQSGTGLLEAALQSNVALPYSCKTGRCGSCKSKVLSGKTIALQPEVGLTEQEKTEGWILTCSRSAETDILLEAEDLGGMALPVASTWPCRISAINRLAPDVAQVLLRLPPTASFHFIPGQYVDVIGPDGIRRSYSLANGGFANKVLELHIRSVEGGAMSKYWFHHAKPNDLLHLNGPLGTFFLRETARMDLFFLATGTGIAPVKAMLESMIDLQSHQRPRTATVIWGVRRLQDIYINVADIPGGHTYTPVLSHPDDGWTGAKGYAQNVLLSSSPELVNAAVYACGSDTMIRNAKTRLIDAGLPVNRFYSDAFVRSGAS